MLNELKEIDLIDRPIFGFKITLICFFSITLTLIILRSLIKNNGQVLSLPNGLNLLISLLNSFSFHYNNFLF